MKIQWPSPFKTYHRDTYPAISPSLPHLSTKGKNVVISGGGSGLGPVIAHSFAASGASSITLLGRTERTLSETKDALNKTFPATKIFTIITDISDQHAVSAAFKDIKSNIGTVHIFIPNAGLLTNPHSITKSNIDDWYKLFDVNVKGNFNLVKSFLTVAAPDAIVLNVSAGMAHFYTYKHSLAYHSSKLAAIKIFDYLHTEYPNFFVLNVHPGILKTGMANKTDRPTEIDYDTRKSLSNLQSDATEELIGRYIVELPADFLVWAASPEAKFLNGKFVWAHVCSANPSYHIPSNWY